MILKVKIIDRDLEDETGIPSIGGVEPRFASMDGFFGLIVQVATAEDDDDL